MTDTDRRTFIAQTAGSMAAIALFPEYVFSAPIIGERLRKVAVIGVGAQGRDIIEQIMKLGSVEVAAVCDVLPTRVKAGQDRAAGAEGFADYRDIFGKRTDIEAVLIATPTHLHTQIVRDAVAAKKHIYCEAPIAHTPDDARAIAAAAATNAGRVFQAGLIARSNPLNKRVRSLIRSDSVRDIVLMYAQHHHKTSGRFPVPAGATDADINWRLNPDVSIGLAGEHGTHAIDFMRYVRSSEPARVTGRGITRLWNDGRKLPDTVQFTMEWVDEVAFDFSATLANSYGGEHQIAYGTNSAVKSAVTHAWYFKEADAATQGWEVYASRQQFGADEGIVLLADATQLAAQGLLKEGIGLEHPPLYYALADYIKSIDENLPVVATAEDAMKSTIAGIAAHKAVMSRAVQAL
ncbi:MAG: Gfo/Idh/MocA family oxidoreductase [Longimicrobiales bacterium]